MAIRISEMAPDFTASSTAGPIRLHDWIAGRWAILFSHPKDFTPVCTTELGRMARLAEEFERRHCLVLGLSTDALSEHRRWVTDIEQTQGATVTFPLVSDPDLAIAKAYDMLPADATPGPRTAADNATVRSVVVIGPDRKVKATIAYPMTTGRNFHEVLRLLDSLQLTASMGVATPVDWMPGDEVIIPPAVTNEEARRRFPQGWRTVTEYLRFVKLPLLLLAVGMSACRSGLGPGGRALAHEVWLVDQSDSPGRSHGGTLYIFDNDDLRQPSSVQPRERIDLAGDVSALCMSATGANPVRPHMLLFNSAQTHAVLSFVASGHVVVLDAATRAPLACARTSLSPTGRQAHAAIPAPDNSFIVVANQNGKRLERINVDPAAHTFTHDQAATLDLATCTTPSGAACQEPTLRPDNAPICPIVDASSRWVFVTLRGGGLFVVDARSTPMRIVAEYDRAMVKGNGCGGVQVGESMFINSGGRPGNLGHLDLYGFDVYRFPVNGYPAAAPNRPTPERVFGLDGAHDSHGMASVGDRYVWVIDRHGNSAEVLSATSGQHVARVPRVGHSARIRLPTWLTHRPMAARSTSRCAAPLH
jgi:alkyl hydroperoxide reductase subunit AhpC